MAYLQILCGILALFLAIYYYFVSSFTFWKSRGVNGPRPMFLFGNLKNVMFARITPAEYLTEIYKKYKNEPLVGLYMKSSPVLVLHDPEIIKDVLIRDFSKFSHRGFTVHDRAEPLSVNLLNLETKRWRPLRTKLSPMFTSAKLKDMFSLFLESAGRLEKHLEKTTAHGKLVNLREVTTKYTIDVIGSCAFGIESSVLDDEKNDFCKMGRKFTDTNLENVIRHQAKTYMPKLYDLMGYIFPERKFTRFFTNLFTETMRIRRENNVYRPDFFHMLMELQEGLDTDFKLTNTFLTAQAFIFFVAGFETSSLTMTNALYELALNPHIQDKLREEIQKHFTENNGQLKCEHIKSMKYLNKVFKETLRKYPSVGVLPRQSISDYTFKDTKISIPKDLLLWIPILAFHHNPDIYPNPDVFNPENFSEEAIAARHPMYYIPFGDGPRNCIGARFASYQSKMGIISIIRNYKVDVCEKTMIPYEYDPSSFLMAPKQHIYLNMTKIET